MIYFIKGRHGIKIGYTSNMKLRYYSLRNQYGSIEVLGVMEAREMTTLTNRAIYEQRYDTYMNTPSDLLTSDMLHFIEVWNYVLALEAYAAAREATIAELTASREAIATRLVAAGVEIGMLISRVEALQARLARR